MKSSELKSMMKSVVKEAIQEELKEILLEALKENMLLKKATPLRENLHTPNHIPQSITPPPTEELPPMSAEDKRVMYQQMINGAGPGNPMEGTFNPTSVADPINGDLPHGEVDLGSITSLLHPTQ